ncbi:hypothetical protein CASFOL_027506 [Castilleja foliolosa]|uniref:Uncharacterized protein n=1 Tax=Castilleja foliolosa TaxID=1961234 RepID=A0ABD3BSP1_9LAMI
MLRLYEGWIEILKIQKFRRLAMMEFEEEGELGDLEFGEKSAEIGVCKHAYHLLVQDVRGMRSVVSTLPEDFSYALGAENTRLLHQKEMDEICERGIMGQA